MLLWLGSQINKCGLSRLWGKQWLFSCLIFEYQFSPHLQSLDQNYQTPAKLKMLLQPPGSCWKLSSQTISIGNSNHCWREGLLAWGCGLNLTAYFSKTLRLREILQGPSRPMNSLAWDSQPTAQSFSWMWQTVPKKLQPSFWPSFKTPSDIMLKEEFLHWFHCFILGKEISKV